MLDVDSGAIKGWRQSVLPKLIDDVYEEGPQYLRDMDTLAKRFGFDLTYSNSVDMLTYEQFVVIVRESVISSSSSLLAIFLVIFIITGNIIISLLAVFSVLLVDLFLIALIPLWNLTFNNIVVVHLVASLGLSVLYSVHISYTFLIVEAPGKLSTSKQRLLKARVALSRIGSSVLHGSISTLIAVIIVGIFAGNSYFFVVFFKMWLGIVGFGMANAFLLIPILLSLFGPTPDYEEKDIQRQKDFLIR